MKKYTLSFLFLLISASLFSQSDLQPSNYCGTTDLSPVQQAFLKNLQSKSIDATVTDRAIIYLPIQVHIVGTDNGSGYYRVEDLFNAICSLNVQYQPANIYWYLMGDIDYINNTSYYEHTFQVGSQMMQQNNVSGRVNVYFVSDPAGNCGYYSPNRDAVAMAKSCAGQGNTTLAHELGHFLSLPHTFSGWEGGTPATADHERADGSNCQSAGDGFCDTKADYVAYRWNCPYSGTALIDPVGDTVHPDETLYMSYSSDHCQDKFSTEQRSAMRQYIMAVHQDLLYNPPAPFQELDTVLLASPLNNAIDQPANSVPLSWSAVPGATSYHVIASRFSTFAIPVVDLIVSDTFLISGPFAEGLTYRWKVKPLMASNTCAPYSEVWRFTAGAPSGMADHSSPVAINLFPSPISKSQPLQIQISGFNLANANIKIYTLSGQLLYNTTQDLPDTGKHFSIELAHITPGIYFLQVEGNEGIYTRKFIVTD